MRILHVGCGGETVPPWFGDAEEVRVDIDPEMNPDVVASMLDLSPVPGRYEMVYSSHCLEHVHAHEVPVALGEFLRVLEPGGSAVIFVPDLEGVAATDEVLYVSPAGPICGLDLIYGHRASVKAGRDYMAHKTGFTEVTLREALYAAGFDSVVISKVPNYNLMAVGKKGN